MSPPVHLTARISSNLKYGDFLSKHRQAKANRTYILEKTQPQKPAAKSSGRARLITAVIVLPFLIASIILPWLKWLFVALAGAAMALGLFEFYVLAKKLQLKPDTGAGFLALWAVRRLPIIGFPYGNRTSTLNSTVCWRSDSRSASTMRWRQFGLRFTPF